MKIAVIKPVSIDAGLKAAIFLTDFAFFGKRIPISQENSDFSTNLVMFLRKMTDFTEKWHFFNQFGNVSEKDDQIHTQTVFF